MLSLILCRYAPNGTNVVGGLDALQDGNTEAACPTIAAIGVL